MNSRLIQIQAAYKMQILNTLAHVPSFSLSLFLFFAAYLSAFGDTQFSHLRKILIISQQARLTLELDDRSVYCEGAKN